METLFIFIIVVLFLLAISDLIVGVSNDAVNFLVSAIGSKSAPFWAIMIIASLGIIFGATFSSGMMEVARKGIFHPQMFVFSEIIIIFLAVMLTDIILLDLFNTFGLPTSTTVSIVFELLGGAVAITILKISQNTDTLLHMGEYINTSKALAIITGILLSVAIAFTVGAIVQYIARFIFSFNYKKTYKYFGAIWGGIAFTAITYFILLKGLKGSSFVGGEDAYISEATMEWISTHSLLIMSLSFVGWTLLLQLSSWLFKLNIFKAVVLAGTFALAMAFAGNDLVNFIGVPLAGLKSYQEYSVSNVSADVFTMEALSEKVQTNTLYLLIAGLIMVVTLWFSKKSRSVTQTSLDLSRQSEGYERFGSTLFSRSVVRGFVSIGRVIEYITPPRVIKFVENRFQKNMEENQQDEKDLPAFDLVRASVNLVVASVLISIATSMTLPLSTTYVTFMVAMGTSLADGAWGRESAVYRITGVISVITGWFFTALIAFTVSFIFAILIYYFSAPAIFGLLALAIFMIFHTRKVHKKRMKEKERYDQISKESRELGAERLVGRTYEFINELLQKTSMIYQRTIVGLSKEDRRYLRETLSYAKDLSNKTKDMQSNAHYTIQIIEDDSAETGHFYVQIIDYIREISNSIMHIIKPTFTHIDNNHKRLDEIQIDELKVINREMYQLFNHILHIIENQNFNEIELVVLKQNELLDMLAKFKKKQVKRIKKEKAGTKRSLLYFTILSETKNLMLFVVNLLKVERNFSEVKLDPDKELDEV